MAFLFMPFQNRIERDLLDIGNLYNLEPDSSGRGRLARPEEVFGLRFPFRRWRPFPDNLLARASNNDIYNFWCIW